MTPRIVIISDSPAVRGRLQEDLTQDDYQVSAAASAEAGYALAREMRPEVIILDFAILAHEGPALGARFKQDDVMGGATLMLLASEEKIKGFDFSVAIDDFILAPLNTIELSARVRLALSRAGRSETPPSLEVDGLVVDPARHEVSITGQPVRLTPKEFELLCYLVSHRGHVCSRPALMAHVWDRPYIKSSRTLDIHIRRLRAKLGPPWTTRLRTVSRVGYRVD